MSRFDPVMEFARRRRTLFATLVPLLLWLFGHPTPATVRAGLACVVAGQAIRVWSAGHIRKDRDVATAGPYAYARNPLYLGSLVLSIGFAIMAGRWWAYAIVAAQFVFFYYLAILSEERYLRANLGPAYADYAGEVPRFWPSTRPYAAASGRFDWGQVRANREHRSYLPVALLCLLFALKAWGLFDPAVFDPALFDPARVVHAARPGG